MWIELHEPLVITLLEFNEDVLQNLLVVWCLDLPVQTIISKESGGR
jgi:hypothetical protein